MTRDDIVQAALECRGVKFQHQGRSLETGVDCVGLLYVVLKKLKYPVIVDVEGYRRSPSAKLIADTLKQNFDPIPKEKVGPGDIFLMRIGFSSKPKHASILINNETDYERGIVPQIIHAYGLGDKGSVVVEPLEQWWGHCVKGYRLRGLE